MLAIGRALMSAPRLVVFDEISLGLSPIAVDEVYAALAGIRASGVAMIVVGFGVVSMGDDEITAELAKLKGAPTMRQPPSDRMPRQPPRERAPLEPAVRPAVTSTAPARRPL